MMLIWGSERTNIKWKKIASREGKKRVNAAGRSRTYNLNFTAATRGALLSRPVLITVSAALERAAAYSVPGVSRYTRNPNRTQ